MKLLALLAFALIAPQEKNQAEETLKRIEEKLAKAETVQAAFRSTFEQQKKNGEKISGVLTGTILLEKGNKARLELEGKLVQPLETTVVSDGKTAALVDKDLSHPSPSATSPRLNKDTTLFLARLGGVTAVMEAQKNLILAEAEQQLEGEGRKAGTRETDPAKAMRLGAFKTGPAAKIDGRDAGAIQFELEEVGKPGKAQVTLWFDTETLLPIRRRVFDELKGILIEETFTTFVLDGKIDPAKFELPKAK